jgi:hypothetical protein
MAAVLGAATATGCGPPCRASPQAYPRSNAVAIGTTEVPVCINPHELDFDGQVWTAVSETPTLCQSGDRVTLTAKNVARYVTASGSEVKLGPPEPYIYGVCG